jgi:hypothetical protein
LVLSLSRSARADCATCARQRGFDVEDDIVTVPDNYPSKGSGERGAFFRDTEGNLLAIGQAIR